MDRPAVLTARLPSKRYRMRLPPRKWSAFFAPLRLPGGKSLLSKHYHISGASHSSPNAKNALTPDEVDTRNEFGVQLLNPRLKRQLFPQSVLPRELSRDRLEIATAHLRHHDLFGRHSELQQVVTFDLPPLLGNNIQEHFWNMGQSQAQPYLQLALQLSGAKLPARPKVWSCNSGWTRYDSTTSEAWPVPYPLEDAIVFDTEVMSRLSEYPVLAAAASSEAWYSWVSPDLARMEEALSSKSLIPLGAGTAPGSRTPVGPRLVVGHDVAFDRARIKEEYDICAPRRGYLDTVSLHVAGAGLASRQRNVWTKYIKDETRIDEVDRLFCREGAMNSLAHLVRFYLGKETDKTMRNGFVKRTLRDVHDDFQGSMTHCAQDTEFAHGVLRPVLEKFLRKCPHPVTFASVIHMGQSIITVDENWEEYIRRSEQAYHETLDKEAVQLAKLGEEAACVKEEDWRRDPWLRNLNWSPTRLGSTGNTVPAWYKQLYDNKSGKLRVTRQKRATPYLVRLRWLGYPIYFSKIHGWCFRVGRDDSKDRLPTDSIPVDFSSATKDADITASCDQDCGLTPSFPENADCPRKALDSMATFDDAALADIRDNGAMYYRIPHNDGVEANCGSPLSQGYVSAAENGILTSDLLPVKDFIGSNMTSSYWMANRERIMEQFVVYEDDMHSSAHSDMPGLETHLERTEKPEASTNQRRKPGFILPQLIPMATITRRAVERTWLTASNPCVNRIGSELKSLVRAPPGYKIVGADVDVEELWIYAVLGDAQFGAHGSAALGWMTVQGSKTLGTDMHSVTAKLLGVTRAVAKQFNYAKIYGAGVDFVCSKLMHYSPGLDKTEALRKAKELFRRTRGQKVTKKHFPGLESKMVYGGSESFSVNSIDHIGLRHPRTPTLNCEISDTLLPDATKKFFISKANWVVQSSGVDYLHMLLVSMEYLTKRHGIRARYMISLHDELRYLVADDDVERAGLALQIANAWTRAMFAARLGMDDLPLSVTFFSCVDIDRVLRKEVTNPCITPSQKIGIAPGETRNIFATLERTQGGQLGLVVDPTYDDASCSQEIPETLAGMSMSLFSATTTLLKLQACTSEDEVKQLADETAIEKDDGRAQKQPTDGETNSIAPTAGC